MISEEIQEKLFAAMPPKNAERFTWKGNLYTVEKGYTGELNVSDALAKKDIVISVAFPADFREDPQSPANNLMAESKDSEGVIVKEFGERTLEDIEIRVFAKDTRQNRLVVDKVIDQLIGWYYTGMRDIVTPKSRSRVISLSMFAAGYIQKQITFTLRTHRVYSSTVYAMKQVNVTVEGADEGTTVIAYSLDD